MEDETIPIVVIGSGVFTKTEELNAQNTAIVPGTNLNLKPVQSPGASSLPPRRPAIDPAVDDAAAAASQHADYGPALYRKPAASHARGRYVLRGQPFRRR